MIFSGYNDFTFAQEAIRYGVTDYVLKPVDPDGFHEIIQKAERKISRIKEKEDQEMKEKNFLQQYFLQNYLYSGKREILERAGELIDLEKWNGWHCAILIESDKAFLILRKKSCPRKFRRSCGESFLSESECASVLASVSGCVL